MLYMMCTGPSWPQLQKQGSDRVNAGAQTSDTASNPDFAGFAYPSLKALHFGSLNLDVCGPEPYS